MAGGALLLKAGINRAGGTLPDTATASFTASAVPPLWMSTKGQGPPELMAGRAPCQKGEKMKDFRIISEGMTRRECVKIVNGESITFHQFKKNGKWIDCKRARPYKASAKSGGHIW
jgi:hypothetical protein